MQGKDPYAIWVCVDCLHMLANGEDITEEGDHASHMCDGEITLGHLHNDHESLSDEEKHSRENEEFSWSECDCCSSRLGGSRHAATLWISKEEISNV